jgi:hypothetical protein
MHSRNTFGAWTSHGHKWIHKIHHNSDFGEATTFPLIVFYVISHMDYIQTSFYPRNPKESQKFQNSDS